MAVVAGAFAGVLVFEESARAAVITVNSTADTQADDGACTLREAIAASNTDTNSGPTAGECAAGSGDDAIRFVDFPGPGPQTITLTASLPQLTDRVIITGELLPDNMPQPDEIVIDGNSTASQGLDVQADDSVVRDLTLVRSAFYGIAVEGATDVTIRDCRVGTKEAGQAGFGNAQAGVQILNSAGTVIRDSLISGNGNDGIRLNGFTTSGTRIIGNFIGTNPAGTAALPNPGSGVEIAPAHDTEVGGTGAGEANLISGNGTTGIEIQDTAGGTEGTRVLENRIGTNVTGASGVPNGDGIKVVGHTIDTEIDGNLISGNAMSGINMFTSSAPGPTDTAITGNRIGVSAFGSALHNGAFGIYSSATPDTGQPGTTIGGSVADPGLDSCTAPCNVISSNTSGGIGLEEVGSFKADRVAILGNRMVGNGGLGIDLFTTGFPGVTNNDPGDPDAGPNGFQNFPELRAVQTDGVQSGITGELDSTAGTDFRIEVFANDAGDASSHGEGQYIVDSFEAGTGGSGSARFARLLDSPLAPGVALSATATSLDGSGVPQSTSEFSLNKGPMCDQSAYSGNEILTADGSGQTLCGLGGNDTLEGAAGGDILDGGDGSDTADLGLSPGGVVAALNQKLVIGPDGDDILFSIENLAGTPFDDVVIGDSETNVIVGGEGVDTIVPGGALDAVLAGDGNDVIDVADGETDALVDCGPGTDAVSADPVAVDPDAIFTGCETISRPPVDPPDPTCETDASLCPPPPTCETDASLCPPPTCETDASLCPKPPDPVIRKCGGKVATIVGTNEGEKLVGTSKRDVIVALAGADKIYPKAGNDIVCAGDGKDVVKGKAGNDLVYGQGGNDKLYGQDNKDTLNGGDGTDKLFGGGGSDVLKGAGGGKDLLFGQGGFDKLHGGGKKGDVCNGGPGKDRKKAPGCEKKKRIP